MAALQQASAAEAALGGLVEGATAALPRVVSGVVFLVVAAVLVKTTIWLLRRSLARTMRGQSPIYRQFVVTVVSVVLWFGVLLSFLSVVGLDGIAVSLGTSTGFAALGVAYALSDMIADVVAGIYLLRDPDFNPGDRVVVGDVTGEVRSIELRKTRLTVEDDVVVMANGKIEDGWRRLAAT